MRFYLLLCGFLILITACSTSPYATTNKSYKAQAKQFAKQIVALPEDSLHADSLKYPAARAYTVNFNIRKPNFVVIHHTAQNSCEQTVNTFIKNSSQVSAHYVICRDGTLHHMLNNYLRAWHAGAGRWGNVSDVNSCSIGIELDNNGTEPFSEAQLNTLSGLLATLKKAYNIPEQNFIGHGDIAPSRKVDPSVLFPWERFAKQGYGVWYSDTSGTVVPPSFELKTALRIIGYDVTSVQDAARAFRRHFLQSEATGEFTEAERKVLFGVMQKFL